MATRSLGTLTIDLIAKVGGFVAGMNQAERASDDWRKQVEKNVKGAGKAIAGAGTAIAAAATGATYAALDLLKSSSESIVETDRWAKSLNMSTQELLAWQFAAEKAGVQGDNIADIFKDLNDKIGDAVLNKSGEAVQALDSLGLSAEKLSKVSPDKQLLAIAGALGKISTTAGKTNILESLGNDLSKLLPLFDNNNEKLKQFIATAKDYGVAPDPTSIDDLIKVNGFFQDMEMQAKGLKLEIATGLAKVDMSGFEKSFDNLHEVLTDPKILQGLTDLISGVVDLAGWMAKVAASSGDLINNFKGHYSIGDSQDEGVITNRLKWLQEARKTSDSIGTIVERTIGTMPSSAEIDKEMGELNQRLSKIRKAGAGLPVKPATLIKATDNNATFELAPGATNGQAKKPKVSKLDNSFKAAELAYQRQIALIDTTGKKVVEVTEQQKLNFDIADGKLAGLNSKQKERLEQLAVEIDRLNALKKASEEYLKVTSFIINLKKENDNLKQTLNIDVAGASEGDEARNRMKDLLGIRQEFLNRQTDLQSQYQSGDITKNLYDKETSALEDSLNERLEIQKKHYEKIDDLRNDGAAGFMSGLKTQVEASANLYANMQQVGSQAFSGLTDMITEWAETGKLNVQDFAATFLQSMGSALLQYAAAQVAMAALSAYSNMIGVPYVGPALAGTAAVAAAAGAGVLMLGISGALHGQAHDGIDAVPETGTWLLQKGERVTTAKTSAKLDATLDRVSAQSAPSQPVQINIPTQVNGDMDARTRLALKETQKAAVSEALRKAGYQLATGTGHVGKGYAAGWQGKRKTG